eukprot:1548797-Amphidinium_carterae.1
MPDMRVGKRRAGAIIKVQAKTAVRCLVLPTKIFAINMMRIFVQVSRCANSHESDADLIP